MRSQSIPVFLIAILLFGSGYISFGTTPSFQGLGDLPGGDFFSSASAVSADGSVVVGTSVTSNGQGDAFRWTQGEGMVSLGEWTGTAADVSDDGSVVVGGSSSTGSGPLIFRWTATGGVVQLGGPGGADGVSADGSVVAGTRWPLGGNMMAWRWTQETGIVDLGYLPGGFVSQASDISSDGSVIVGFSGSTLGKQAFRWTSGSGMFGLGDLPGGPFSSSAYAVSADGSVVVGASESSLGSEAFRWTSGSGMVSLGGGTGSEALDCSADGSVVVGVVGEAFIWDAVNGIRNLSDVLVNDCGLDLTGWTLTAAKGISADGFTIVGEGTNPDGFNEAWIATIPEPATLLLLTFGGLLLRKRRHE
jgi:probable HAF family extracellular repeat protein